MRTGNHRCPNFNWRISDDDRTARSTEHAILAVLMDIREELRGISGRLDCPGTMSIPRILRRISANTHKVRKRRKR